jgi:hypothetical protein
MEKLKSKQEIIDISLVLENIGKGEEVGIANALVRPYRLLINEERRVGKITHSFYQENTDSFRIFGSFCYTPSNRLLFFPGIEKKKLLWDSVDTTRVMPTKNIDHFTLESNRKSWHVTVLNKTQQDWLPSRQLLEIEPEIFLWFGLSVKNPLEFEKTPKETKLSFPVKDSQRAINIFHESRDKAVWNILQLHPDETLRDEDYLHFDVYLDFRKLKFFKKQPNFKIAAPTSGSAINSQEVIKTGAIPARSHKVKLRGFNGDVWIVVSRHRGSLLNSAIITTIS